MARSISTHLFAKAWSRAEELVRDELHPEQASRRRFISRAGAACGGLMLTGAIPSVARGRMAEIGARRPSRSLSDEVAIVGAGFAGLIAAYRLRQADVIAKVYEGDTRVGGRAWTLRGFFNDDQIAEAHAEFIDGYHYTMIRIAQEAGLELENLNDIPGGLRTTFEIDGAPYPFWRIVADLIPVVRAAIRDGARAGWDTTFYESTPYGRTLDAMSVTEWIEARISGGMSSRIGQLLDVHIRNEYGMEPAQLS